MERTSSSYPAWSRRDTAFLARLPLALLVAWTRNEATWERVAHSLARRRTDAGSARHRSHLSTFLSGRFAPAEIERIATAAHAARTLRYLQILRCHHPRGWHPVLRLDGREHLDAALAQGRGAILWVTPFAYASLATKATLDRHGLPLTHLSRWQHGPSRSRWGIALINPIQRRAEDRFLRERVVITPGRDPLVAMRRLLSCLAENRVVSITLGEEASRTVAVPFLGGVLHVPLGPIKLAARSGAPLMPTHTVGVAPTELVTTVAPPLPISAAGGASVAGAAAALAAELERQALPWADQLFWPGGLQAHGPVAGADAPSVARRAKV